MMDGQQRSEKVPTVKEKRKQQTPVAPHEVMDCATVLLMEDDALVALCTSRCRRPVLCWVDSEKLCKLEAGDTVTERESD